jgi:hypothetical protein
MKTWKQNLIDYMVAKSKPRDFIVSITHYNIKLIAILQLIKDEVECFENFSVELRRTRFLENIVFPLQASTFVIKFEDDDLVEYQFMWVQNSQDSGLDLQVLITNRCHQRFDEELKVDMGCLPDWLEQCKYCEPIERIICSAVEMNENLVAGCVVEYFQMMTNPYLT